MFHDTRFNIIISCAYNGWMEALVVQIASKRQLRKAPQQLIGENLKGEEAPFYITVHSGIDIQPTSHVFILNLVFKVLDSLEQNERFCHTSSFNT